MVVGWACVAVVVVRTWVVAGAWMVVEVAIGVEVGVTSLHTMFNCRLL